MAYPAWAPGELELDPEGFPAPNWQDFFGEYLGCAFYVR